MARSPLLLVAFLLLSVLSPSTVGFKAISSRKPQANSLRVASRIRGGAGPPGFPNTMFPADVKWSVDKAAPKESLSALITPQNKTAAAWILNLIELVHWASFPLGFYVAHKVFVNAGVLSDALDGDVSRVFFIVLGLLCQVFGGGISGNMMVSCCLCTVPVDVFIDRRG